MLMFVTSLNLTIHHNGAVVSTLGLAGLYVVSHQVP